MKAERMISALSRLVIYMSSFFILSEWLTPILEVTHSGSRFHFMLFVAFSLALYFLRTPWFISFPLKLIAIVLLTTKIFDEYASWQDVWPFLKEQYEWNVPFLFMWDIEWLTNEFRTFLFFILLWMFTYFIHYWTDRMKRLFLFAIVTWAFFIILHMYGTYDSTFVIPKVMAYCLVIFIAMYWYRMSERNLPNQWKKALLSQLVAVVVVWSVAFTLPTSGDQMLLSNRQAQGEKATGYSEDDEQLGGTIQDNDAVVMKVKGPAKQYWKIETKDTYTSKGWANTEEEHRKNTLPFAEPTSPHEKYTIQLLHSLPYAPYPYQMEGATPLDGGGAATFTLEEEYDRMRAYASYEAVDVNTYQVTVRKEAYSVDYMRTLQLEDYVNEPVGRYLQLPNSLPNRVRELATSIVEPYDNVYDQVKAVEHYFAENGYVYDKANVPVPQDGEDYVDQFLFESQVGYCDNYSTSMVVMLRSLGIPARWAKGYAFGEQHYEEGEIVHTITQNDAHSWVEVYMKEEGWVPFEPTLTFTNPADFHEEREETPEVESAQEEVKEEQQQVSEASPSPWKMWVILIALVAITVGAGYTLYKRKRREPSIAEIVPTQYERLLKKLKKKGFERHEAETYSTFAEKVSEELNLDGFIECTKIYEKLLYNGMLEKTEWLRLQQLIDRVFEQVDG